MQLTPLDIYQKEFRRKKLNGLDPEDVEQFLFQVAEGLEALLHENARLAQKANGGETPAIDDGTDATGAPPRQDARRDVELARQEARRITDEARANAKATIDDARAEARRILDAAAARGPHASPVDTRQDPRARQFAVEYQSILVKHLAQVTQHLGDADDDRRDPDDLEHAPSGEDNTTEVVARPR